MLPLEAPLVRYIRKNCSDPSEIVDIRQEVYERALTAAAQGFPENAKAYLFAIARNLLITRAKRARIVSFELVAEIDDIVTEAGLFDTERHLTARGELRRAMEGMEMLPPRCREVVQLRKVEGLSTREVAERMGTGPHTVEKQLTIGMRALADFMLGGSGKVRRPPRSADKMKKVRGQ